MNMPSGKKLNFENTEVAFSSKSDADLNRAYWLFKVISSNFLTQVGPPLTNFFLKIGLPVQPLIKATIFKQFCGGETIEECEGTVKQLAKGKVGTILDYSVEGEDEEEIFDSTCGEIIKTIERAEGDSRIPVTVFKITGIGRFTLLEKIGSKQQLTAEETIEFNKVKARCEKICNTGYEKNVPVMIDAEESWIQDAIDVLALAMMRKFNRQKAVVYNTYQMYRKDKLQGLKTNHLKAKEDGFLLGVKIVRGAYMEKESARAEEMGYPSPIQPDKNSCDYDYNRSLEYCVIHVDEIALVCGTHNEESCGILTTLLDEYGVVRHHPHVYFAQLLGMSDNLSFNLSDAGYNVAKYVPYGPIKAVLPYLFRRAQENTSIAGQTGRELSLIIKEKQRRRLT